MVCICNNYWYVFNSFVKFHRRIVWDIHVWGNGGGGGYDGIVQQTSEFSFVGGGLCDGDGGSGGGGWEGPRCKNGKRGRRHEIGVRIVSFFICRRGIVATAAADVAGAIDCVVALGAYLSTKIFQCDIVLRQNPLVHRLLHLGICKLAVIGRKVKVRDSVNALASNSSAIVGLRCLRFRFMNTQIDVFFSLFVGLVRLLTSAAPDSRFPFALSMASDASEDRALYCLVAFEFSAQSGHHYINLQGVYVLEKCFVPPSVEVDGRVGTTQTQGSDVKGDGSHLRRIGSPQEDLLLIVPNVRFKSFVANVLGHPSVGGGGVSGTDGCAVGAIERSLGSKSARVLLIVFISFETRDGALQLVWLRLASRRHLSIKRYVEARLVFDTTMNKSHMQ